MENPESKTPSSNMIEDLLNKITNLQKYKTDAEHTTSTLMNALEEKETEIESLSKQLARAEERVSIISQDIKDIQASSLVAEEKLQRLQTENASLKSVLSKATNKKEHKLCNMKLSVKEKEIIRLKGIIEKKSKPLEAKLIGYEGKQSKNLEEEQEKTKLLIHQNQVKEDELTEMRIQYMRLQKGIEEYKKFNERSAEREKKIVEQQTEFEKMCKKIGKVKQINDALSEKNDNMEDRIRKLQSKLDHLERVEETHHLCVEIKDEQSRYIKELECEVESQDQNFVLLQNEYEKLDCRYSTMQAENAKVEHLQSELDAKTEEVNKLTRQQVRAESSSLEVKILQREKENIKQQNIELTRALQAKSIEMESLIKHRERSEERIRNLNNEISEIQKTKRHTVNESFQHLLTENASFKSTLDLRNLEYEEKISTLTKTVEDIKGSENQAADENIKGLQKKIGSLESELRNATTEMNDLSYKYKCLQTDKESAEYTINKLSRNVQEKEMEISSLIEDLAKSNENVDREEHTASANSIQKLNEENASLKSKLSQLSHETEKKVSALTKEIKSLQKSKGTSKEEYNARKLYEENEFLKVQLDRTSRSYEQLRKDYNEVKREKDHALNSYDQKGRDSNEVKTERDHSLKRCNLGPEGNVKKDPKPTGLM